MHDIPIYEGLKNIKYQYFSYVNVVTMLQCHESIDLNNLKLL